MDQLESEGLRSEPSIYHNFFAQDAAQSKSAHQEGTPHALIMAYISTELPSQTRYANVCDSDLVHYRELMQLRNTAI